MRLGLLAILVGTVYLLKNLNLITTIQWSILWPIIIIYIGIAMVGRNRCLHCGIWHDASMDMRKKGAHCDCEDCENKKSR